MNQDQDRSFDSEYYLYFDSICNEYPITNYQNYGVLKNQNVISKGAQKEVYSLIIRKVDSKNYSSMLTQLAQKTIKNDIKFVSNQIEDYQVNLKLFLINNIVAECNTPVNNSKKTKSIFCLRVLLDEYPDFLQLLFDSLKEKSMSKFINKSFPSIQFSNSFSLNQSLDSKSNLNITNKQDQTANTTNQNTIQKQYSATITTIQNQNQTGLSFHGLNQQQNNNILESQFSKIYKELNNKEPPEFFKIENNQIQDLTFKPLKNYSYAELIQNKRFQQILKKVMQDQGLKYSSSLYIKQTYIQAKFNIKSPKKQKIEYKLYFQNDQQKNQLNNSDIGEFLALNFLKDFIPSVYKILEDHHQTALEEIIEEENDEQHHIWDLFYKDDNFEGVISQTVCDDLTNLKRSIQKKNLPQFNFGNQESFDILHEYFNKLDFSYTQYQQKTIDAYKIGFNIVQQQLDIRYKIEFEIQCKNLFRAMQLGEAKFIEIIFGSKYFKKYIQNYLQNKQEDIELDKIFFNKFNLQLSKPLFVDKQIQVQNQKLEEIYKEIEMNQNDYDYDETLEELFEQNYEINLEQEVDKQTCVIKCHLIPNNQEEDIDSSRMVLQNDFDNSFSDQKDEQFRENKQLELVVNISTINNTDLENTEFQKYAVLQILRYFNNDLFMSKLNFLN